MRFTIRQPAAEGCLFRDNAAESMIGQEAPIKWNGNQFLGKAVVVEAKVVEAGTAVELTLDAHWIVQPR